MTFTDCPFKDAKLAEIRRWLSAPDPSTNYRKAIKQRQNDTGLWFLESDPYNRWKTDSASFLWLYGIPGCGKTILSSTIIQNLLQRCEHDPGIVLAYFYFDFNDAQKQNSELMLRSLICQLSQQCVSIPVSLGTLFCSCDSGQRQPSTDALTEVLRQIIQEYPQAYIILDALDECSERTDLTDTLETMAGWQLQNLHVLVTSRRERDIENSLETFIDQQNTICFQSELVDKDIQKYVRQMLSNDKRLSKWGKDPALRKEIEAALVKGAHGMYD
jgi:Cdc6-like AAA superfamily ATPase